MLIGARLIPLLFPMLASPAEGVDIIAFDIGLGEDGEGAMPPPELLFAEPEEELDESEEEAPEEIGIDPAAAPPCWWPADSLPEPPPADIAAVPVQMITMTEDRVAVPEMDRTADTKVPKDAVPTSDAPQPSDQMPDPQSQADPPPESPPDPQSDSQDRSGSSDPAITPDRPEPVAADAVPNERTPPDAARPEPQRSPERPAAVEDLARRAAPTESPPAEPAPQTDGLGDIQVMFEREGDATRITLVAERAETVDLMRRHADQLQSELAREGLADANLNFAERHQHRQNDGEASSGETAPAIALPPPVPASGLDLRL